MKESSPYQDASEYVYNDLRQTLIQMALNG
jgi:hypothetical protein